MGNIEIAKQTIRITKEGKYTLNGRDISLPSIDYTEVNVISPEDGKRLLETDVNELATSDMSTKNLSMCRFTITTEDSFQAGRRYANPLVMNFANAHNPGGGFMMGANAQEEALCRCSTLYASIKSEKASRMYIYNNTHLGRVESDYMLISHNVVVFRNERYELLEEPVVMGVVTIPAPNRYGAALLASEKMVEETMIRRIRIMCRAAIEAGYKVMVLGAWGCGAFGNKPENVSDYFKRVLVDEGLGRYFDEICFAIYGKEDGRNITEFRKTFE
jgi:uncharacterized protein (TIGR02452 family)